ncbi:hypothetical protein [Ensifer aridi]|uniref:hypothetical protein n=1 Tax=Ensifer aridi TaxID=1708715 RepID=UPI001F35CC55|nr:hypothetical protein [Ensifer aridi]
MVTKNPADLLGSKDRGRIAPGLRADLLRRWRAGHPQRLGRRATISLSRRSGAVGTTLADHLFDLGGAVEPLIPAAS